MKNVIILYGLHLVMFISIIRPLNCVMVFSAVIVLSYLTTGSLGYEDLAAAFAAAFACAGGNVANDYFDAEADRRNRPQRPIPSGRISPKGARELSLELFGLGLVISISLGLLAFAFVLAVELSLIAYSAWIKKRVLLGNALVSLMLSLVVVFPSVVHATFTPLALLAAPLFLLNLSREVVKDIGDMAGDKISGKRTFALARGPRPAALLATSLLAASFISVALYLLFFWDLSLALALVMVAVASLPTSARFIKAPEREVRMLERFEKAAMAVLLAGVVF